MRQIAFLVALGALATAGCAQSGGSSEPAAAAPRKDVLIQFDDVSLEPPIAHVAAGGSVAWTSESSSFQGVISFPDSITASFTCKELRPDFFAAAGRIRSIPIGTGIENVALPCPLKAGSYEYRVDLYAGGPDDMTDPLRSLPGKLVVE